MLELVKIVGALAWIVGLITLFLFPPVGMLVLLVAGVISIYTATKTRDKRHKDLVRAASQASKPTQKTAPSLSDRLKELEQLKEQGAISDEEYEKMRQQVLDQL